MDFCSRSRERWHYTNTYYWNPINAPEANEQSSCGPMGCLVRYPIALESGLHDQIEQHSLLHHRRVSFTLNDQADSHHFTWEWHDTVRLDTVAQLQPIGDTYQADALGVPGTSIATRVRVVWNQFDPINQAELPPGSYDGPDRIVTYSDFQLMKETLPSLNPGFHIPELMVPIPLLRVWWSPRWPAGYLLGHSDVEQTFHVYALSRGAMQVVDVRRALFTDAPEQDSLMSGVSGTVSQASAANLQAAVFLFQPGRFALTDQVTNAEVLPSKLWLGVVSGDGPGEDVAFQSTEERFGTAAPLLFDVALIPLDGYRLLVLGSAFPGGSQNVLWSLDLGSGQWTGPATLDLPAGIRGLSAVPEPVSNQILLFGGDTASGVASAALYLLDPITLAVHAVAGSDTTPAAVPRSQAGIFLDAVGQVLYVYGGQQGGVALTDAWRYSLTSSTWELLGSGDVAAGGPGPALAPLVYHDSVRDVVWVGDFDNANTADGLPVHALSPDGTWRSAHAIALPSALTWPVDDTFVFGQSRAYLWPTPEGTPLPGSHCLGQVSLDAEGLGLKVSSASGAPLGRSDPATPEVPDAAFRCPTGQRCTLEVKPMPGGGGARDFTPFILDVKEAAPVLQVEHRLPGRIADLALYGDLLVAAGPAGLWTLDHRNLAIQGHLGLHPVTGLVACGGYLCVSKLGLHGLKVVGLSDPAAPRVLGSTFTLGLGWDVAASGQRAFVAHGVLGVGIYDVSTQGQPAYRQTIWAGGLVRTVAVQRTLLAAGRRQGGITLYDISAAPMQVGSLQAQGKISRVRFVAGQLWVLGKHKRWVEIWDVSTPSAPVRLGRFNAEAAWHFRAVFLGASALTFDGKKVQRHDLVPVAP